MKLRSTIVISANSVWNLVNFRHGLIEALTAAGFGVTALAPADHAALLPPGVKHHAVPMDRSGMNPLRDLKLIFSYVRAFRAVRPAACLSFTIKPNIYGALAARLAGVPSLPNVSGLGTAFINDGLLSRFVTRLYRAAFRTSPIVFFQNPDDLAMFVARKIVTAAQARLLPGSGINLDAFIPAAPPDGSPTFLLIARLLGDKGVREFADAARLLKPEFPDARFQLLGPIDAGNRTAIDPAELRRWVDQGIVEYLGESTDVRPFISRASAVVLPSYREGVPRTLLEAAAMARPMVATDVPGCREIVVEGVTGLLCEARSASSLASAMRRMIDLQPADRAAMGEAARHRVETQFNEKIVVDSYLRALRELGLCPESGVSIFNFSGKSRAVAAGPAGTRAYVVGDIHGRLDLLDQLLGSIEAELEQATAAKVLLIFLGDLIDRGPDSRGVVDRLRNYRRSGVKTVFLAGNHEEVLLRILDGETGLIRSWLTFGGAEFLASYGANPRAIAAMSERRAFDAISAAIPPEHVDFIKGFSDTLRFGDYLFVHAGIRPGLDLSLQSQTDLRWIRQPFLDDESDHGFVVVHGHTISDAVDERPNRIGIDTGAYRSGILTAMAIEGEQRWLLDTRCATATAAAETTDALI